MTTKLKRGSGVCVGIGGTVSVSVGRLVGASVNVAVDLGVAVEDNVVEYSALNGVQALTINRSTQIRRVRRFIVSSCNNFVCRLFETLRLRIQITKSKLGDVVFNTS